MEYLRLIWKLGKLHFLLLLKSSGLWQNLLLLSFIYNMNRWCYLTVHTYLTGSYQWMIINPSLVLLGLARIRTAWIDASILKAFFYSALRILIIPLFAWFLVCRVYPQMGGRRGIWLFGIASVGRVAPFIRQVEVDTVLDASQVQVKVPPWWPRARLLRNSSLERKKPFPIDISGHFGFYL